MDDFSFMGKELSAFGAEAAFGASMRIGAKVKRSEYELPGGGSIIIGEDTFEPTQRQVTIIPADGVEPTPGWRRDILGWLQGGRGELFVHNDPDVMRIAQFDQDGTWGTQGWPDGSIALTMTLQPLCYARRATVQQTESVDRGASVAISAASALPMPLKIRAEAISGTVSALTLQAGGEVLALEGMQLAAGQAVEYDAGSLIGDVMSLRIADGAGYAYVKRWAKLTAMPGTVLSAQTVGGEIRLTAICRGRWTA